MNVTKLTETQSLSERNNLSEGLGRVRILEDVEELGLDPDIYIAIVSAELGRAGVVNRNGRIYQVKEFVNQNEKLGRRVSDEFVDGELGHPSSGPTFEVPARLISVETKVDNETALATGKFAILNTSMGKDVLTLFKAGMEIGTSSRGSGILDEVELTSDSRYAEANPDFIGKKVGIVSDFLLDTYDLVRVPSAGTRVLSIEEALENLSAMQKENDMAEDNKPEAMEEGATVDPFANLDENQKVTLLKIVNAVKLEEAPSDNRLAKEVAALREQVSVDRERQTINEAEFQALREEVVDLREQKAARDKADAVGKAILEATEGRRFGAVVKAELDEISDLDCEEVSVRAERLFTMIESTHTPVENPVSQEPADVVDDVNESVETEAVVSPLPTEIDEQLRRILGR